MSNTHTGNSDLVVHRLPIREFWHSKISPNLNWMTGRGWDEREQSRKTQEKNIFFSKKLDPKKEVVTVKENHYSGNDSLTFVSGVLST